MNMKKRECQMADCGDYATKKVRMKVHGRKNVFVRGVWLCDFCREINERDMKSSEGGEK